MLVPLVTAVFLALMSASLAADHPVEGDFLRLRDPGNPERRVARFRASRDPAIQIDDVPDPRITGADLEIEGTLPGDGSSGTIHLAAALWQGLGKPPGSRGYRYLDPELTTGVRRVVIRRARNGGAIVIAARKSNWPYTVTQPQGSIHVRLSFGSETYCAAFHTYRRNEVTPKGVGIVVGRKAPPPATCAPAACGNGVAEGLEECDDGNTTDGDGCSADCELENTSAVCAGVPTASGTSLDTVLVASGLASPVDVQAAPLDPNRIFVVEKAGRIRVVKNGALLPTPFLSIEGKVSGGFEQGLLGLAFHPDYENNGRFFVNYTDTNGDTVVARYQVSADPDVADPASETVVLTVDQPFSNHNAGQLAFGPDGYLYVGLGDGGSGFDPADRAQDDTTLLGKMLRIDVDVDAPPFRAVPPSNPNAGAGDPLGLVWAKGLRNPWRYSFDRLTGDLLVADVGQNEWEEIDFQPASSSGGENYGWDIFEGTHCLEPEPHFPSCPDPPVGFTMPIHEYSHAGGACSVTGGYVYRGCRMPDLRGTYFYADWCAGFVRTFEIGPGGLAQNHADRTADLAPGGGRSIDNVTSFGQDARGELYIADQDGEIFRIVPGGG
ncbi:MAG: hypothetical protein KatS3mg076_2027 [Candidatus Binatia bacterium]|nr:MAG: hypothetical protein KatS3mg076_2027 [Candidatus Binatia bacterium]